MYTWNLLALAILVLANVHHYQDFLGIPLAALLWLITIFTITAFYLLILALGMAISKRYEGFFVYFPVVGLIAMTITTFVSSFSYALMSGETYTLELATTHLLFNLALGFLFETLFMFFVYPVILQNFDSRSENDVADVATREVIIAGKAFAVSQINYVSSQDHYLQVNTASSNELLRGRLADVVAQLSGADGIVPHRSHWVSRSVVDSIGGKSGAKILNLTDGTQIPIARSKVSRVQKWFEQ